MEKGEQNESVLPLDSRLCLLKEIFRNQVEDFGLLYTNGKRKKPSPCLISEFEIMRLSPLLEETFYKKMMIKHFILIGGVDEEGTLGFGIFDGVCKCVNDTGKKVDFDFHFFYTENGESNVKKYLAEKKQSGEYWHGIDQDELFVNSKYSSSVENEQLLSAIADIVIDRVKETCPHSVDF